MMHPQHSGAAARISLKFSTVIRANTQVKVIMVCIKKFLLRTDWTILGQKMAHPYNSALALRIFSEFCRMKGANRYIKILWEKKIHLGQFNVLGHFLLFDWAWLKLSQATVTIGSLHSQDIFLSWLLLDSLNSQDMIRILKQPIQDFPGKHLCDGYCMDIWWFLCVELKLQKRVMWFCIASLNFLCKFVWI